MVSKGNHPQMALIQVSEILQFITIYPDLHMCVSWDLRDLLCVVAAKSATSAVLEGEELNDLPVTILKFGWGKEHTTDPAIVFFHDENEDWHSTSKQKKPRKIT